MALFQQGSRPTRAKDDPLALAEACGASRLDGGMHFTGAVAAGEELC